MSRIALTAPEIFDGETLHRNMAVVINDGLIDCLCSLSDLAPDINITRFDQGIITPGFIDLQVNGGGDFLFNNTPTVASLKAITDSHRLLGTTSLLPTVISDSFENTRCCIKAVKQAMQSNPAVLGVHLEGPYFNVEKRGVHPESYLRQPTTDDVCQLEQLDSVPVLLTLAPEKVPLEMIEILTDMGIKISAGHTNASYEQIKAALEKGLDCFTHIYNAMSPLTSRSPGVVGAALEDRNSWAGIIVDGVHSHLASFRIAYFAKPLGKLFFVSDAMATVGGITGQFTLFGERIEVQKSEGKMQSDRLVNSEGHLAGSAISLADAVKIAVEQANIPTEHALAMASRYPAEYFGVDHKVGWLKPGYRADLVCLDDNLQVRETWVAGINSA